MVLDFTFWKNRLTELAFAGMISMAVIQTTDRLSQRERDILPPTAWFEVYEVFVPDFATGTNPTILYDRIIREEFRGFFVVEVQRQLPNGLWFADCSGSGIADYSPDDALPEGAGVTLPPQNNVTWDWFINRQGAPCRPEAGTYRLRISYELSRPNWPVKTTLTFSNIFQITS